MAFLFVATVSIGSYSRQWIVGHLMSDFEQMHVPEKQQRLAQIAELGLPAIEPLVGRLIDKENEVARTAYELLRESQNTWTSLDWNEARKHHHAMVTAMANIASAVPDDRTGWTTSLVQQTIMESVQKQDQESNELYKLATSTLSRMSLTESAGPSILNSEPLDNQAPVRLAVRSKPLPVTEADALDAWTDWPLPQSDTPTDQENFRESSYRESTYSPMPETPPTESVEQSPSVYRSSAIRLTPVAPDEAVVLSDIRVSQAKPNRQEVVPTSYLTDSPLETYDTPSVIHWLGSEESALRERAKTELAKRGFSQQQIALGIQISSPDPASRLALVDAIARSRIENPRAWLVMLLDDANRAVRLRTISVIATMNDAEMSNRLRERLDQERDPVVNARIRLVLNLR
ncbi:HEAT repeat domain-containing protein [Novipirellula herctigrandis]|uniref:HEAT repeat domain-containing protein n=1 Tax=Novipirellula herctigrandis TaxID=2527986 RepID=UPI003AF347FE